MTLLVQPTARLEAEPRLTPFLKWPGGKSQELRAIAAVAPPLAGRLIDPFVGGGSILLATPADVPVLANDACRDLISLYVAGSTGDHAFQDAASALALAWDAFSERTVLIDELVRLFVQGHAHGAELWFAQHRADLTGLLEPSGSTLPALFLAHVERDLPRKFVRMRAVERKVGRALSERDLHANVEGAVRSALYMAIRRRYNEARSADRWDAHRAVDFLFLREFAYAAMFRFNAKDQFNVPYGGVTYNRKSLEPKLDLLYSEPMQRRLRNTTFACEDFEPFVERANLNSEDFMFIDPPYDSDFSDYDNMPFGARDQVRLRDVLEAASCQVMVVIKDTPAIRRLYGSERWQIVESPKTYMWTIKSRNDRTATHLTITNY